jgi:putrescine aminotransferase
MNETSLWHPFANMAQVRGKEYVIARAEGVWLWTQDGEKVLDATASLWYANVGHGREEIRQAVSGQLAKLDAYSIFGDYANPPALELADRLTRLSPVDDAKLFLTTGGGESIDTAAKIARQHWHLKGQPERTMLIGRVGGYHGTNGFGTSIGGIEDNRAGWGPLVGDTVLIPHDSVDALDRLVADIDPERIAAMFLEPVIGAGGVLLPPKGYIEGIAGTCEEHGILLVVDSVICGFGRLGTWYGIERWDVVPDMIVFAKGVTSGYLPLGGVVASGAVAEPFYEGEGHQFRHGPTYSGHPACCAAAHANLNILESEGLLNRALDLERWLDEALQPLSDNAYVREVRSGLGAIAAVELEPDVVAAGGIPKLFSAARDAGVLSRPLTSSVALSPPLIIEQDEVSTIAEVLESALETLPRELDVPVETGAR